MDENDELPPLVPNRPDNVVLVDPKNAPKRGKGGNKIIFILFK